MSAFDVIVTVALGTLLSSTIVTPDPSYVQATTAVVTLLVLQVTMAAVRGGARILRRLIEFDPEVVVRHGRMHLPTKLSSSQLSESELRSRLVRRASSTKGRSQWWCFRVPGGLRTKALVRALIRAF